MAKNETPENPPLEDWLEKAGNHLAEYEYFSTSESYLFEACNIIRQLRAK